MSQPQLTFALSFFLLILVSSLAVAKEGGTDYPNIVFIMTDDQGYGDLSCHGNPILKTPNVDQLANDSIRLTDFHVAPTCSPTRASILTGHWTNRTGVWHTIAGRSLLKASETTIAKILSDNGYATGIFGKWHLGDNAPFRPQDRGFEEVFIHGGGGVGQTPDFWNNAYVNGTYFHNGLPTETKGWCTPVWFDRAKQFMQTQNDANVPFFAYIATNAPHGPFHSNPEFRKPYAELNKQTSSFFGMIAEIDDEVGKLRNWLVAEGLDENTILIFTTDNGTAGGDKVFNAGMRGRKGSPYEGGHRVPFFVHWPNGNMNSGRDVEILSHAVDIVPTLLDLCGVQSSILFDGVSLKPALDGKNDSREWDQRILVTDSQRVLQPQKWRQSCVMRSDFRLVNRTELYRISDDPGQKKNIANKHPEEVARLNAFYETWWEELSPGFNELPRIRLGDATEKVTMLTCHDWAIEGSTPWNQALIRQGKVPDEPVYWNVNVAWPGKYRFTLRRWPEEIDHPITAGLKPESSPTDVAAYRETPGHAFSDLKRAELKIGAVSLDAAIGDQMPSVTFQSELSSGDYQLRANFVSHDNHIVGAYYVQVELLSKRN